MERSIGCIGDPVGTTATFPYDLDTTSLALSVIKPDSTVVNDVINEMLQVSIVCLFLNEKLNGGRQYVNSDGIIQVRHVPPL
jgi:hypothetical protein